MMRLPTTRKYLTSIMGVSVALIILDIAFFGLSIAGSPSDFHLDGKTLYSIYWLGLPLLVTAIVGITTGARNLKALVVPFMVLSIITCLLAASFVVLFLLVLFTVCGSFGESGRVGRDGKTCDITEPINSVYIAMVTDAVLIFFCCVIGSIFACNHACSCCSSMTRDEPEVITLTPITTKHFEDPFS